MWLKQYKARIYNCQLPARMDRKQMAKKVILSNCCIFIAVHFRERIDALPMNGVLTP